MLAQLGWLDNVDGIPKAHSSLLLIGQQGWNISLAPALASHLVEDFVDGTPKAERMQRHSILVRHLQQANQLLLRVNILYSTCG
jgi:hypothetical protein